MIEWQNNPPQEYMTWYEAVDYAESLSDGWRLPTRGELIDAYDCSVRGFMSGVYWSSSTYAHDNNNAWYVFFYNGVVDYSDTTNNYYVRCVREVKEKNIDPHKLDSSRIIIDRGELKIKDEIKNKIEQLEKELNELKNKMTEPKIITQKTWIEYAKTLPDSEVVLSYVNEIESITNCYGYTDKIEEQIYQIIQIYKSEENKK